MTEKSERNKILELVRRDGDNLEHTNEVFQDDKEIVLEAVRNWGDSLQYASSRLRNDREVVLEAIKNDGEAFEHASEELRNDETIAFDAIRNDTASIEFLGKELLKNKKFILTCFKFILEKVLADSFKDPVLFERVERREVKKKGMELIELCRNGGTRIFNRNAKDFGEDDTLRKEVENLLEALDFYGRGIRKAVIDLFLGSRVYSNLAECYGEIILELEKSQFYFQKAIKMNPNDPLVYRTRMGVCRSYDVERSVEDFARMRRILPQHPKAEEFNIPKQNDRDGWYIFEKDDLGDEKMEEMEIQRIRKTLEVQENEGELIKSLQIVRYLGGGSFGRTYLCQVKGQDGLFVLKVCKPKLCEEEMLHSAERDSILMPYSRNIGVIYLNSKKLVKMEKYIFPDYEKWIEKEKLESPIVLMKYHRKTIGRYLRQRVQDKSPFSVKELLRILQCLLNGVSHLLENMIVHRDLHPENVFVDEAYGRLFIGDFGCALDLRKNKNGFRVLYENAVSSSISYSALSTGCYGTLYLGGKLEYLAPEIVDFEEKEKEKEILDYSKNDLFSVGMIGYFLVSKFHEGGCAPFGKKLGKPVKRGRRQENYIDLEEKYGTDKEVARKIAGLLRVDHLKRSNIVEAMQSYLNFRNWENYT